MNESGHMNLIQLPHSQNVQFTLSAHPLDQILLNFHPPQTKTANSARSSIETDLESYEKHNLLHELSYW